VKHETTNKTLYHPRFLNPVVNKELSLETRTIRFAPGRMNFEK